VLNVAIDLYSYTKLSKNGSNATKIVSHDWEMTREITNLSLEFDRSRKNNVDIVKAVMQECGLDPKGGYELLIHSMAPKNSGLAGSSALMVSLLAAMFNLAGKPMMDRNMFALTANRLEREVLRRSGGCQDQYAAVFGGFNFIEFSKSGVKTYPLRLQEDLVSEWHSSMMLFETPFPRTAHAHELETKKEEDVNKGGESVEHITRIRDLAYSIKDALFAGDSRKLGEELHLSWEEKRCLPGVSLPGIDKLYQIARQNGAYGGKLCGAGGGGFLFLVCDVSERKRIANALAHEGARAVNFNFDFEGMVSWRTAY
jgi:D-glycero-alpha-D-manno-heptose-7-phosphate kinase